jgi:hypothetical protein
MAILLRFERRLLGDRGHLIKKRALWPGIAIAGKQIPGSRMEERGLAGRGVEG